MLAENGCALGKKVTYKSTYDASTLFAVAREKNRQEININNLKLPFFGYDVFNHYEVSWLNKKGKPQVFIANIVYDCSSPFIVESKSLKLYFNSFNNSKFDSLNEVKAMIQKDLSNLINSPVRVNIFRLDEKVITIKNSLAGTNIDNLDITCDTYTPNKALLTTENNEEIVRETLCSDLLKSNCLVTGQPDWGSVQISYEGKKIQRESLLKYIISFRDHNEFHEHCIERIFADILYMCKPSSLSVAGFYTRRGGIDINPFRSTKKYDFANSYMRLIRQ